MKTINTINSVSIAEIIADTGREKPVNNFHVFTSEEIAGPEQWVSKPIRIDHFIIILVTNGSITLRLNLISHEVKKNGLILISPNVIHECTKETDCTFTGIGFIPDFFLEAGLNKKHAEAFTFFSAQHDPFFQLNDEESEELLKMLLVLRSKDGLETAHPFKEELIHHGFNLFMFELAATARKYRGSNNLKMTRKEEIMMSFLKLLPHHFKEERSVQYYASQLFVSPKHLTKTVKELTNKTCSEFIDEMVIIEAKVLLNDRSLSVANIADYLHFSDQFFFSKYFKNLTGLTPTQFRTHI